MWLLIGIACALGPIEGDQHCSAEIDPVLFASEFDCENGALLTAFKLSDVLVNDPALHVSYVGFECRNITSVEH